MPLVSPAAAVQLLGNSNDDDGVDPPSFANDSTSNHRIDVVHAIIGNADVDTELRLFKIMKILVLRESCGTTLNFFLPT